VNLSRVTLVALTLTLAILAAPAARAQDSDAPEGALGHWLPTETWVYEHWLPYDEGRLYELLDVDRGDVWRHLRDDAARNLAQLGERAGYSPRRLALALVEPRRDEVSAARFEQLRKRALRTITQGHLSQHLFFHNLHQLTIPDGAPEIFGTASVETFLRLRRADVSPQRIGRLHGRDRAEIRRASERALRATAARGVRGGHFTAGQARLLVDRQLRQLPRWLGQRRYNGPPQTIAPSTAELPEADYANHPQLSGDGTLVAWDTYRVKVPESLKRGEIGVLGAYHLLAGMGGLGSLWTPPVELSAPAGGQGPVSAYNAALAAGGQVVAFEAAAGNENFAKRYGQMTVVVRDLISGHSAAVSHDILPPDAPARTAYNPTISGDGRLVAFEASDSGRDGRPSTNGLWLVDRATGAVRGVRRGEADATYDPALSADGSTLVFTAPSPGGSAQVHALDVASGATEVVSRAGGERGAPADRDAVEPAVSADGRVVAFASSAGNLGERGRRARVFVRDRRGDTTRAVPTDAPAFGPAVSPDGEHVTFSVRRGVSDRRPEGSGAQVWLYQRTGGAPRLVSRADGPEGRGADGHSLEAVVSRGGRLVAFTSDAANLDPRKPAGLPGVFVRDTARGTTRLMSSHAPRKPEQE
jgi:hypothetical protein